MTEAVLARNICLYSEDLLLGSRIAASADENAIPFRRIDHAQIESLSLTGGLLFIDLDIGIPRARAAIARARLAGPNAWHVCGYGSHVDFEGLRTLKEAGCDRVVSRSRLVSGLQDLIKEVFRLEV